MHIHSSSFIFARMQIAPAAFEKSEPQSQLFCAGPPPRGVQRVPRSRESPVRKGTPEPDTPRACGSGLYEVDSSAKRIGQDSGAARSTREAPGRTPVRRALRHPSRSRSAHNVRFCAVLWVRVHTHPRAALQKNLTCCRRAAPGHRHGTAAPCLRYLFP